jgi:glycosyltransferase involved in cell wall biosynthesis
MWNDRTVAVVLPTYREKATIRAAIEGFEALGVVDEIIVVNNNAEAGTSEEVAPTSAREVFEPRQGYGASIRRGIASTDADLICVFEPDGTFEPTDLFKLLAYAHDFDFVYGSRTIRDLIWTGANMGNFLRWGNWGVAKLIEVFFNTNSLTDVGCTMRLVSGPSVRAMQPLFTIDAGAFGPEMMLLSILGGWRVVQLPINYRARRGHAGTTESFVRATRIGLEMIGLIFRYRVRSRRVRTELSAAGAARRPVPPEIAGPGGEPQHMLPRPWHRESRNRSRTGASRRR